MICVTISIMPVQGVKKGFAGFKKKITKLKNKKNWQNLHIFSVFGSSLGEKKLKSTYLKKMCQVYPRNSYLASNENSTFCCAASI